MLPVVKGLAHFPPGCLGKRGREEERGRCMFSCREAVPSCFFFLMTCLQVPTSGTTFFQEPRLIVLGSCPSVSIAQAWFPWQHLQRRMLGFQALWPWVNNWLVASEKPRTFLSTFSKAVYSPSHQTYRKQVK